MTFVEIRRATDADLPDLASVHVRAWQWAYRGLMDDAYLDALDIQRRTDGWNRMILDRGAPRPHIAVVNGELVGFIHADRSDDVDAGSQAGRVTALYLLEEHAGTGLGYRLWEGALDQLRGHGFSELSVWVLEGNQRGLLFYERMGLAWDGTTAEETIGVTVLSEMRYSMALNP
ncbi:GNAT family N-acetyltransferase [Arthrobacter sp. NPDC092385]|uniref:GNAT family N-acetyltransferase n=1 Tax=Arthrobacter sp. NPDC092385 TaxID=3363943 RepID=UPI003822AB82